MSESPTLSKPPSALQALVHYLVGGLVGALLGLAFAALVFYLVVLGFLYSQTPIHGATQETVILPNLADFPLTPPIAPVDLEPPEGKTDAAIDTDYLGACWQLLMTAVDARKVGSDLLAWAIVAGIFGLAMGLIGVLSHFAFGQYYSPIFGIVALLAALAGIGIFVSRIQFEIELPIQLNVEGRLIIYGAVAALNLLWLSVAGFRFRAILFILTTVLVGEGLTMGLPPETWTTTAMWHACLFLFVPTGYAWRVVERAKQKGILF